jgi:hypothetical protein
VGLSRVTPLAPLADASATLVAFTVTVLGFGKLAGAANFPFESMVPTVADPPFIPFTDHATVGFDEPLTVA